MRITFWGAAQEVTGSQHLIEVNGKKILLECGFYQGRRAETYRRNLNFEFDAREIDAVILSHAHIDHSGNLPNLVKRGFTGNIWCTAATRNLSTYMLLDSAHIQESDAEYVNRRRAREGQPLIEPIYTKEDAKSALSQFVSLGLRRKVMVTDGVELNFMNAGHILGSAVVVLDIADRESGRQLRLVFSGDLGRKDQAIVLPPDTVSAADYVIVESTYGDRLHPTVDAACDELRDVVRQTARRRGKVIIRPLRWGEHRRLSTP